MWWYITHSITILISIFYNMITEKRKAIIKILDILVEKTKNLPKTLTQTIIDRYGKSAYHILVIGILGKRTRDTTVLSIIDLFFQKYPSAEFIANEDSAENIRGMIHCLGFSQQKSIMLHRCAQYIMKKFKGIIPKKRKTLQMLPSVGPKISALIMGEVFDVPAICVDTHVARITFEFGLVDSKKPADVEETLKLITPKKRWTEINRLFVLYGQHLCKSSSRLCLSCPNRILCKTLRNIYPSMQKKMEFKKMRKREVKIDN